MRRVVGRLIRQPVVFEGDMRRRVPLGELTPEDVDDDLLEELEFYAADTMGPYVVRDSEAAREAVDRGLRVGELGEGG